MDRPSDCPICRSSGAVLRGECQVCFEEVPSPPGPPGALRFADVVAELEAVATLATVGATGNVTEACRRARVLLECLRGQFLAEVILAPPDTPPVPEAVRPAPDPDPVHA
jgi:hypothetical protein